MIFTTLRYKLFKLTGFKIFNLKGAYNQNILTGETLFSLKQKMKQTPDCHADEGISLSSDHLRLGSNIHDVYSRYGKPAHQRTLKLADTIHDVVLYKRIISGLKSKIIYNFVDQELISIAFHIRTAEAHDKAKIEEFVKSTYFKSVEIPSTSHACLTDAEGNKFIYENTFDCKLTFINHKPKVLRSISSALYRHQFAHSRHNNQHTSRFELSF